MAQRRRWCLGHYQNLVRNWPQLGSSGAYVWRTFPNFFLLNAFLPTMLLLSALVLIIEPHRFLDQCFWLANLAWIGTVYIQRGVALAGVGRRTRPLMFLFEPPATAVVHTCALFCVLALLVSPQKASSKSLWSIRAR
jgi:hypothetical protein